MRVATLALAIGLLIFPSWARAQTYSAAPKSQTAILPGEEGWRNYVEVADAPCGCNVPVRTDCYDEYCPGYCGCRPLCLLRKVCRALDCLLPCNSCLGGCRCGAGGCGCVGPHGCMLDDRWGCGGCGGCGIGCGGCRSCCQLSGLTSSCCASNCCAPSCCTPSCSTGVSSPEVQPLPPANDPFKDDPATPPSPTSNQRGIETRWNPLLRPSMVSSGTRDRVAARSFSPWKTSTSGVSAPAIPPAPQPVKQVGKAVKREQLAKPEPTVVVAAPTATRPIEKSVLRKTSHESNAEEPATIKVTAASPIPAPPLPPAIADFEIPQNPLRP